jgi:hypothetical protein
LSSPDPCVGEDRFGCCMVKPASQRAEPWPVEERADRGTASRGDGSEIVIRRCRFGSSPEVRRAVLGLLPRQEGLDDTHAAAAAGVWRLPLFGLCGGGLDGVDRDERQREQRADTGSWHVSGWSVGRRNGCRGRPNITAKPPQITNRRMEERARRPGPVCGGSFTALRSNELRPCLVVGRTCPRVNGCVLPSV